MMKRYRHIGAIALLVLVPAFFWGCGESGKESESSAQFDGASLLGLASSHQLHYQVFDSTVTYDPQEIHLDTIEMTIALQPGANNQVTLSVDGAPHDLLTIDPLGVLHSGQIQPTPPDTIFFYPTPLIMPRTLIFGAVWNIVSPPYTGPLGEERRTLLYLNYGYYTKRTYLGRSDVILPGGSFEAYHCRSLLFLTESSPDTQMVVDEFYSPTVGLVKLESQAPGRGRRIILIEDH